jgi:hypothetical protein
LIRRFASGFSEASPGCTGNTPRSGPAKAPASNHIILSCQTNADAIINPSVRSQYRHSKLRASRPMSVSGHAISARV